MYNIEPDEEYILNIKLQIKMNWQRGIFKAWPTHCSYILSRFNFPFIYHKRILKRGRVPVEEAINQYSSRPKATAFVVSCQIIALCTF